METWTSLLASHHLISPICKVGMILTSLLAPRSYENIKLDYVCENVANYKVLVQIHVVEQGLVPFSDLLQWRDMEWKNL